MLLYTNEEIFFLASTIPAPTLFIARNNGFAISTPSSEQYHGDGIAARGPGYGMHTIRVDGNDVLAVLGAVREGRRLCIEGSQGVLIEAMTYRYALSCDIFRSMLSLVCLTNNNRRVGHHSTSDDSFAYRPRQEVEDRKRIDNPIARFRAFLEHRGWWNAEDEEQCKDRIKKDVMKAFKHSESLPRHELHEMFSDVYGGKEPWNLVSSIRCGSYCSSFTPRMLQKEQREELQALLKKYGDSWEPWKNELKKYKGEGKQLILQKDKEQSN